MMTMAWDEIALVTPKEPALHYSPYPRPNLEAYENAFRVQVIEEHLRNTGIIERVIHHRAEKATLRDALMVHTPYLVDSVRLMTELGSGEIGNAALASPELLDSALSAVGGAMRAADTVTSGRARHAFALVRPPGHHASQSSAGGLCFFNNVAVAVRHAMKTRGVGRVSILDFDDHHGDGTSDIFYADKSVQYISIHEYDQENYGRGHYCEVGYEEAEGTNINIPLFDSSPDESYAAAIDRIVRPIMTEFRPDIIAVSAGYDPHYADPVGNMDVDSRTFWRLGSVVREIVDSVGAKGSFWVLEGGYNPSVLGLCVQASLTGLAGDPQPTLQDQVRRGVNSRLVQANLEIIEAVRDTLGICT
ncbi:MAG: histone deacetylase [Candidatus Thorarchaeota archaeon]|nr:histone deacetylase [Candidatus Thorarchaeota archaeon]